MPYKGSIRTVNLRIRDFTSNNYVLSRTASLAYAKLAAKFEEPASDTTESRRKDAWLQWIGNDANLRIRGLLGPNWAKARLIVHDVLSSFKMGPLTFTNGSSFEPLGNKTSIACKLSGSWTITADCFETFAYLAYRHKALKHSVKKRFTGYCKIHNYNEPMFNKFLWKRFKHHSDAAYQIFCFKLHCSLTYVYGNRWSTVPKNNLKDRSICLEPFCNMLVQRALGLGIRTCLHDKLGIDLDFLADVHRNLISNSSVATIDLSNCSDTISMDLVRYLIPSRVFKRILACRSDMTLGPDDEFYFINKVSSMGNGFTFDLMSLILTALTKVHDPVGSVYGDDIVCHNHVADSVVQDLVLAGFVVNVDKTLIRSDYRESCGSHYLDGYGYLTVFDLRWLKSPHDLIVACNKVAILSNIYGEPFTTLQNEIWSCVPQPLLGAATQRHVAHKSGPPSYDLSLFIRYGPTVQVDPTKSKLKAIRGFCRRTQKRGNISVALAFESRLSPASSSLLSKQWDVFYQYIQSARLTAKYKHVVVKPTLVARVGEEQIGLVYALSS